MTVLEIGSRRPGGWRASTEDVPHRVGFSSRSLLDRGGHPIECVERLQHLGLQRMSLCEDSVNGGRTTCKM